MHKLFLVWALKGITVQGLRTQSEAFVNGQQSELDANESAAKVSPWHALAVLLLASNTVPSNAFTFSPGAPGSRVVSRGAAPEMMETGSKVRVKNPALVGGDLGLGTVTSVGKGNDRYPVRVRFDEVNTGTILRGIVGSGVTDAKFRLDELVSPGAAPEVIERGSKVRVKNPALVGGDLGLGTVTSIGKGDDEYPVRVQFDEVNTGTILRGIVGSGVTNVKFAPDELVEVEEPPEGGKHLETDTQPSRRAALAGWFAAGALAGGLLPSPVHAFAGEGTMPEEAVLKIARDNLTPFQQAISLSASTERAFTGVTTNGYPYDNKEKGTYLGAISGTPLFESNAKYDSGTGWPSFFAAIPDSVIERPDPGDLATKLALFNMGVVRTEVIDAKSGAHLGHVFPDGPAPTGKRYCMNAGAMTFMPADPKNSVKAMPDVRGSGWAADFERSNFDEADDQSEDQPVRKRRSKFGR